MKVTKLITPVAFALAAAVTATSCRSVDRTMREPYTRVDFVKGDFDLSGQVTGSATTTKVLGIDFYRWFHPTNGAAISSQDAGMRFTYSSIPVVGNYLSNRSASYALYNMMEANPGYDVVFYPQYESRVHRPILGIGFLYKKTWVKASARLAKLK